MVYIFELTAQTFPNKIYTNGKINWDANLNEIV